MWAKRTEGVAAERGFLPSVLVLSILLFPLVLISLLADAPGGLPVPASAATSQGPRPLAGFRAADEMRLRVYAESDHTLVRWAFTADGPAVATAEAEVEKLHSSNITDRTTFETLDLDLLAAGDVSARVRQKVVVTPSYFDASGLDVTIGEPQLQVIVWEMRLRGQDWLIHSGRVVRAREFTR